MTVMYTLHEQGYNSRSIPDTTPLERGYLRRRCRRRHNHRLKTQSANQSAPPTVPMTVPINHGCWTMPNCSRLIAFGPEIIPRLHLKMPNIPSNLIWDFYSSLNRKELLLGPLECHDDVQKRSLKQECFEMSPEWMQWLSRCNFARQIVSQKQ